MPHIVERRYGSGARIAPHAHETPSLSLVVSGTFRERAGSERTAELVRPLSVSLMPASVLHDDEFGAHGALMLQVHFDAASARVFIDSEHVFDRWRWLHGGPAVPCFVELLRAIRANAPTSIRDLIVNDVIAAAARLSIVRRRGTPPRWLLRVRECIDDSSTWPTVGSLAEAGGVHRAYLARQFRRYYGCAVSEHIRRRAIQRAALHMTSSTAALSAIAHASGFTDQPHFCRAFRAETGVTPTVFRSLENTRRQTNSGTSLTPRTCQTREENPNHSTPFVVSREHVGCCAWSTALRRSIVGAATGRPPTDQ